MSNKQHMKNLSLAAAAAMTLGAGAVSAEQNPFAVESMPSGVMHLAEMKCGEGKCGNMGGQQKGMAEGKCGGGMASKEKKMGEGKCGNMQKKPKKAMEGKCGEGKCGNMSMPN